MVISLRFSIKDKDFLEKIKILLGANSKTTIVEHILSNNKKYETVGFSVTSRDWKKDLKNKYRINKIPNIPKKYLPHYIRGYFDGDGSIYLDKQANSYQSNFVFSSIGLAEDFANKIRKITFSKLKICKKKNTNCWYFRIAKKGTMKLGHFLYKDATIYLKRKKEKFII